jgi:hypothetical protein
MGKSGGKKQDISLGSDFDAVVRHGGTTVELKADGNVIVITKGNAIVYANGDVTVRPSANDAARSPIVASAEPKTGDKMSDGTVFAGISPDTGEPMYTTPEDAPLTMQWKQAMEYAGKLAAYGHRDWRMPSKGELNVLFQNRAAIGGFDISGSLPAGWYWSSTQYDDTNAWAQRFSDGGQLRDDEFVASSLRCVR